MGVIEYINDDMCEKEYFAYEARLGFYGKSGVM